MRTGSPGRDEGSYYAELERTGRWASFNALMEAQVRANAEQVASVYDWSPVAHVVDVGGGTGVLLRTLLDAYPHLRATLFDLPQVVEGARAGGPARDRRGRRLPRSDPARPTSTSSRGSSTAGRTRARRRSSSAVPRRAATTVRILLVEGVVSERPTADEASFDLFMLVVSGGGERTLEEFRRLAERAGLEVRSSQLLSTGNSLVELGR